MQRSSPAWWLAGNDRIAKATHCNSVSVLPAEVQILASFWKIEWLKRYKNL